MLQVITKRRDSIQDISCLLYSTFDLLKINPIRKDSELQELLKNVTIPGAGVVPAIHSILLPRRSDKPTEKSSSSASLKTK
jgi:hypothetical protein